jgi:16S rRNA G1207 methylase RsmC
MNRNAIVICLIVAVLSFGAGTQVGNPLDEFMTAYERDGFRIAFEQAKARYRMARLVERNRKNRANKKPAKARDAAAQPAHTETTTVGKYKSERTFHSVYLDADLIVPSGVFMPGEAEAKVLPMLSRNADFFAGKTVLEIGAGSGPISIFAAKSGAVKVVSTDISPEAVGAITANAERLGVGAIVEARLVPLDDMGAYSVIGDDEQFDIIISNPPYALDLDATTNTAAIDNGELGFSIVRGFEQHLKPGGVSLLYYDSLFYHQVMKKFARYEGYEVTSHNPIGLYTWAAEALFNSYLQKLLLRENMDPDAFRFVRDKDGLNWIFLRNQGLDTDLLSHPPIVPGSTTDEYYAGWLSIQRSDSNPEGD